MTALVLLFLGQVARRAGPRRLAEAGALVAKLHIRAAALHLQARRQRSLAARVIAVQRVRSAARVACGLRERRGVMRAQGGLQAQQAC